MNTIVQDQQGFIWFGTQDGLNRFDGHTFQVYGPDLSAPTSLTNGYIWKLLVARDGTLWIGTYSGGLNRFDPRTARFTSYRIVPDSAAAHSSENVTSLYEGSDGVLWVGTWGAGAARVVSDSAGAVHFVQYVHEAGNSASLTDNRVADIREDKEGNLWIATWGGVSCLRREDRARGVFASYRHRKDDPRSLSDDHVWTLAVGRSGEVWLGTWGGGLCRYDAGTRTFLRYTHTAHSVRDPGSNSITALCSGSGGELWVGTSDAGLSRFDPESGTFAHFRHDPYESESIGGNGILSLLEDRSGGLWVGHEGAGISQYDPRRDRFLHYRHIARVGGSLGYDNVRALADDGKGGFWVGMRGGGVDHLAPGAQEFIHFRKQSGNASGLSDNLVLSLLVCRNGDVLIGTQHGGLNALRRTSTTFDHFLHRDGDARSIAGNSVCALHEDSRGFVWVGTNGGGLDRLDTRTNHFIHYTHSDTAGISALSIWTINEDRSGALWVGTWGMGLFRLDVQTGSVLRFMQKEGDTSSLGNNTVFSVAEDSAGYLWVGTEGGGLNRLDPRTGKFLRFTRREGLPNNTVYGILPDAMGNLWLSTNRGLVRFDPRTRQMRVYDSRDGLQDDEFNQNAYCRMTDGRLLFGGIGGFNEIRPDRVPADAPPPNVVLTDVRVLGKSLQLPQASLPASEVVLRPGQEILSFEFVALDFAAPEKSRYAYMLEGFDKSWIDAGAERIATYTSLPGGAYTFRVRACNGDGVWNPTGAALALNVIPPMWETWWFRALAVLLCAGIVVILYESRLRRLVEIERMRTRIASDLHDDIGSRLTRIAVQSEIIRNTDDTTAIRTASSRIGTASREIITTMSDVIWSIDARNDTWGDLLRKMRDCAAELFEGTSVEYSIEEKGCDLKRKIPVDVRQNLYLIFKEALNNARRHSGAKHVTVGLHQEDGRFRMEIADDGHGLRPHESQGGQGFRNMRLRADRIHATLHIVDRPGVQIVLMMDAIASWRERR